MDFTVNVPFAFGRSIVRFSTNAFCTLLSSAMITLAATEIAPRSTTGAVSPASANTSPVAETVRLASVPVKWIVPPVRTVVPVLL